MREFNKIAYDQYDMSCKIATIKLMESRGYTLIGDINTEYYKKHDGAFENKLGKIIKIENEYRGPFDKIKKYYLTIHIPIRKKNTECDYYFIWGNDYKDLAIINKATIKKYNDIIINQVCAKGTTHQFTEKFIDIPKNEVKFYTFLL